MVRTSIERAAKYGAGRDALRPARRELVALATAALMSALACMGGCASDTAGAGTGPTGPREATVRVGEGLVLSTGEVVQGASYLNVDLILYKNQGGFDIKPGGDSASTPMAMKVFGSGGVEQVFDALDDVPKTLPDNASLSMTYMQNVATGWGATVQHNIGDGYSRIWIKAAIASASTAVIQWDAIDD
jgi:hypothetical protein